MVLALTLFGEQFFSHIAINISKAIFPINDRLNFFSCQISERILVTSPWLRRFRDYPLWNRSIHEIFDICSGIGRNGWRGVNFYFILFLRCSFQSRFLSVMTGIFTLKTRWWATGWSACASVSSITVSDFIPLLVVRGFPWVCYPWPSFFFSYRKQRGLYQGMANV